MTFEERQTELFFEAFHVVSNGDLSKWLEVWPVVEWAGERITRAKADALILKFTESIHYVEKNDEGKYRLSDSGKVYYDFLKKESTKYELDRQSVQSTINTGILTRMNIKIGWLLGIVTLLAILTNLGITIHKECLESKRRIEQTQQQSKIQQNALQLNQIIQEISQSLKDTSKVKVKIEK